MRWLVFTQVLVLCSLMVFPPRQSLADDEALRFFENQVRPVLVEHCAACHGEDEQSAGLRIDSRQSLLQGGDSGPAIVPGDATSSLIVQAVQHRGGLEMPPEGALEPHQVEAIAAWVNSGAIWPDAPRPAAEATASSWESATQHWAFQSVREPAIPTTQASSWIRTPVDAFVLARLEAEGLSPSPQADRQTLIRRATYALTGLPPSAEATRDFVQDPDPAAYERLIERLLDSPQYGEHWARMWLDVARYSDTKGYVYAREERFWVHAWSYRDWVVQAFNEDLPYDRFLLLQLAADQIGNRAPGDLAAMGFLTLGRRFLGVKRDVIDDRIDVVCRGTMGLTVGCARCHNHKYDPIPTADYYSLYGVFDSSAERLVSIADPPETVDGASDLAYQRELKVHQENLAAGLAEKRAESSARARSRIADYLRAQTELDKYPVDGFDQILQESDLLPAFVRRWENYLRRAKRRQDPVFLHWHAYRDLATEGFAEHAVRETERLREMPAGAVNPLVASAFATPPASFDEVIERYSRLFADIDARWQVAGQADGSESTDVVPSRPEMFSDPAAEQLRGVLYGPAAPCQVPDESIVHIEGLFDSATCTELWKLQGEVDRWIIYAPQPDPHSLILVDRSVLTQPQIFRRGNPANKGAEVPRQFLELLSGPDRQPFQQGSGRLEMARAIVDPANPLTARVMVNRVWTQHFQQGLVSTPSDFGLRAEKPSHPELLDFLAARFVAEGWSLKRLHRWILLSATFQQQSSSTSELGSQTLASRKDPQNRLLWRMNSHRLTFEEFRDSLLAASGDLELQLGGKPVALFAAPFAARRTLYGLVDRQFLPSTLRVFDFANPDLHIPQRSETTVPQQALFFMNHPFVLERAKRLAARVRDPASDAESIRRLFERVLQREPTARETAEAIELLHAVGAQPEPSAAATAADWQYGCGAYDEAADRVQGFAPLPHFTGTAWQGGEQWPDGQLGWVQLTAMGGHPGNDRLHAAVRRWTAPTSMTIFLASELTHSAAPGDGVRAFVVSSRTGLLGSARVHQETVSLGIEQIAVEAGETIDFVVDIGDVLDSDQYSWRAQIEAISGESVRPQSHRWDSTSDFTNNHQLQLDPWEQLAQVMLCTNEFLFVD